MRNRFQSGDRTKYGKRHKPGQMNLTEGAYAALLDNRTAAGEVEHWHFEAMTFKLAENCRYTPDFAVYFPNGTMEYVDVKGAGPIDPKSLVKIKCAAEKFPQFQFVMEKRLPKKEGGGWKRTEF